MLEVSKINRSFDSRQVLTDVSFDVAPGRMTGFVGANGAGKTTAMRIILGVLAADSGVVRLNGTQLTSNDRQRFGYMPEERGLYPKMKAGEQLIYLARLHGLSPQSSRRNTTELLELLELADRSGDPVEKLSLGNQQRVQIAAALVHEPEALILDEPFSGLDPLAIEVVLKVLTDRARTGIPVLFSSHQLDVVERLCDDLVIISDGVIRASGGRDELRSQYQANTYEATLGTDVGWLRDVSGVSVTQFDGQHAIFEVSTPGVAQDVLRQAVERGDVISFAPRNPRLTDIFKEVVQ